MDRRTGIAVASVVLAIVLLAIGAYSGDDDDTSYFLIASAITIAVAVVLVWVIVPRVTRPGLGGLIIGVLAIVSLAASQLPSPERRPSSASPLARVGRKWGREPLRSHLRPLPLSRPS